jgi:uncharacterized membrane protein YgdD (TMEM256/DUF423 family)
MNKFFVSCGALLGAFSVALGAFGAHRLRALLPPDSLAVFETGVRYQFYHGLALLFIGISFNSLPNRLVIWSGRCFLAGTILFSGSLYVLTFLRLIDNSALVGVFGILTPLGGLLFIIGWLLLFFAAARKKEIG